MTLYCVLCVVNSVVLMDLVRRKNWYTSDKQVAKIGPYNHNRSGSNLQQ